MTNPIFTVAIPTYNRRELLERNLVNLEALNFDNEKFEVIVVDDGSTDGTDVFVNEYQKQTRLNLKYFKKENGGKFTAVSLAIEFAQGYFFVNCDSDDFLHEDCLQNLLSVWNTLTDEVKESTAGIIGNNYNIATEKICGSEFPSTILFSDPIEMRFVNKVTGDKFPCIKTDIMRRYKFPNASSRTKFIPESYIYYGISSKFSFLYTNKVFKNVEYQSQGLSSKIQFYRIENAFGCYLVYRRYIELIPPKKTLSGYVRNYINYVRFGYHCSERKKVLRLMDVFLFPIGLLLFMKDLLLVKFFRK